MKYIPLILIFASLGSCSYIQNGPAKAKPLSAAEKKAILDAVPPPASQQHKASTPRQKIKTRQLDTKPSPIAKPVIEQASAPVAPAPAAPMPAVSAPSVSDNPSPSMQPIYKHPAQEYEERQKQRKSYSFPSLRKKK